MCGRVPSVQHRTGITIVQHPRERRHPFGTVRIARMGLGNVTIHVSGGGSDLLEPPAGAAVLFPDPSSSLLSEMPPTARPAHIVAIDGTWAQAAQLRRTHRVLARLPAVRLAPATPSRYRIRQEPNARAVSTLEAIICALEILEPETEGLTALLSSFDAMIDDQLRRRGAHPHTPRHRHTWRVRQPLPEVFANGSSHIALIYAELHQPRGQDRRFALRVTAARAEPRAIVDALVRSPIPPSAARIKNMELGRLSLDDALDAATLATELRRVIRPTDTLVAWAQTPAQVLRELGFEQPFLSAKHHFANQTGGRLGTIDDVVAGLGGPPVEAWVPGRAGREVAQLARVVSAMRVQGLPSAP